MQRRAQARGTHGLWSENLRSIGVEHANRRDGTVSEACLDNGAHLVAALCRLYGLGSPQWKVNVFPRRHFSSTSCPDQIYGSRRDAYISRAQLWYDRMGAGEAAAASPAPTAPSSDIDSLGRDVIAGRHVNGDDRRRPLGANYAAVQQRVNELLS